MNRQADNYVHSAVWKRMGLSRENSGKGLCGDVHRANVVEALLRLRPPRVRGWAFKEMEKAVGAVGNYCGYSSV